MSKYDFITSQWVTAKTFFFIIPLLLVDIIFHVNISKTPFHFFYPNDIIRIIERCPTMIVSLIGLKSYHSIGNDLYIRKYCTLKNQWNLDFWNSNLFYIETSPLNKLYYTLKNAKKTLVYFYFGCKNALLNVLKISNTFLYSSFSRVFVRSRFFIYFWLWFI